MAATFPKRIDINPWADWSATGGGGSSTARIQYSGEFSGGDIYSGTTASAGWYIEYPVLLNAGTWTLDFIYTKYTPQGICDVKIDGTVVATQDMYGTLAYNSVSSTTGISVATAGIKTLRFEITGKNASSSRYDMYLNWATFKQTA